jgi:polysaccharide biosynthesis transport protein
VILTGRTADQPVGDDPGGPTVQTLSHDSDPDTKLLGGPAEPHVEILSRPGASATVREPLRQARRLRLFAAIFVLVLAGASIWNFSRPALYRAEAMMLIEVPQGIGYSAGKEGSDAQNQAVQARLLLTDEVLGDTLTRIESQESGGLDLTLDGLRGMLNVIPTPGTNLVELSAVGSDPARLPVIVNAWADAYLARRQTQTASDVDTTLERIQQEYDRLDAEKRAKAKALDRYRMENGIDTMEEEGNQAPARLAAVTRELNVARTDQVKAEAKLRAFDEALTRGEQVVPLGDQASLQQLQTQATALRNELAVAKQRYTKMYLESEPVYKEMPKQLAELEAQIKDQVSKGQSYMRSTLIQDIERARRQTQDMERQIEGLRAEGSRFTTVFSRYQTLKKDLEEVDIQHRDITKRLMEIKAKAPQRYAQVKVVEPAVLPTTPFEPAYWRDFVYSIATAGLAALLAVLLYEFLTRRERHEDEQLPVTGVRVYAPAPAGGPGLTAAASAAALPGREAAPEALPAGEVLSLPGSNRRELLPAEVRALSELADPATRQLIGLLLSGLTVRECVDLEPADILLNSAQIRVPPDRRTIPLSPALKALLAAHLPVPIWIGDPAAGGVEGLLSRIGLLAHDAGLAHPDEVNAAALRHTYICYLVRQGARLTEIERIVGRLPAAELARYGVYSPAGAAKPLAQVELAYPAL